VRGARVFVEQVRSRGQIVEHRDVKVLREGDVLAVSGPRTTLVEVLEAPGSGLREVDDRELLDLPVEVVDVVMTSKEFDGARSPTSRGTTCRACVPATDHAGRNDARRAARHQGAAWRRADRHGLGREHRTCGRGVRRGRPSHRRDRHAGRRDRHRCRRTHRIAGAAHRRRRDRPEPAGRRAARRARLRLAAIREAGNVRACAGGDAVDLRVHRARGFRGGRRPQRRPDFVQGLRTSGPSLVLAGALTISASLLIGVLVGRWIFKMHPACCSEFARVAARLRRRSPRSRRPRAVRCRRSDTAWRTPWATSSWPSGAP